MLKLLAELWLMLIVLAGVLLWFVLMGYLAYMSIFGENIVERLCFVGLLAFMITMMAMEILDSPE